MCSTYSLSQIPITKQNSPYQDENFLTSYRHSSFGINQNSLTQTTSIMLLEQPSLFHKQKPRLVSFVEKIKNDQTIPLLNSSITPQTIKPYGLTDITPHS